MRHSALPLKMCHQMKYPEGLITALMLLRFQFDTKSCLLFTKPGADGQNASSSSSVSAAHVKVMAEKVIQTQCTFHRVSLASVSLNSAVNKSEWQPGSLVAVCGFLPLCCFIPCVPLSCPSSSEHSTQILIPAFVSSAGSREHWCYPESFWQTVTNRMRSSWNEHYVCAIWYYDLIKIQLWKQAFISERKDEGISEGTFSFRCLISITCVITLTSFSHRL